MKHTSPIYENPEDRCLCDQKASIPFLDTSFSFRNGKISVDLYRKPTDRNQYLLTNSIHPPDCLTNIPYSLALRITEQNNKNEKKDTKN